MMTKTYFCLDYNELDDLIKNTYGHVYEMVPQEELSNDSTKTFENMVVEELDAWEQKDIDDFKVTGKIRNWRTITLIKDMINKGVLQPGSYLVDVSW